MFKNLLFIFSLFTVVSCSFDSQTNNPPTNQPVVENMPVEGELTDVIGTVVHNELEGGFWGIISNTDMKYEPMVLPDEFKINGIKIRFSGEEIKDAGSIYMWGTIIKINEIESVN